MLPNTLVEKVLMVPLLARTRRSWKAFDPAILASMAAVEASRIGASLPVKKHFFSAQSPTAKMSRSLVRMYWSTRMAPLSFRARPASLASAALGFIPSPRMTRSAGMLRPSASSTDSTAPSPAMRETRAPVWMSTPFSLSCSSKCRENSRSKACHRQQSANSMRVTFLPSLRICSANSTPIKPPPMTETFSAASSFFKTFCRYVSSLKTGKTFSRS